MDESVKKIYINPIFKALNKNNASPELLRAVFLDCNMKEYFQYLSDIAKNDPTFIKKCIEKKLITYDDLPEYFKKDNFITIKDYNFLLQNNLISLDKNLYKQDEFIVLSASRGNLKNFVLIEEEFKQNHKLMYKCLERNRGLERVLDKKIIQEILKDKELTENTLLHHPQFFDYLSENEKKESHNLLAMLTNSMGYSFCKAYLRKSHDPKVALKALEVTYESYKELNQKYIGLLKDVNKYDRATYFKKYLEAKNLQDILSTAQSEVKSTRKVKI